MHLLAWFGAWCEDGTTTNENMELFLVDLYVACGGGVPIILVLEKQSLANTDKTFFAIFKLVGDVPAAFWQALNVETVNKMNVAGKHERGFAHLLQNQNCRSPRRAPSRRT